MCGQINMSITGEHEDLTRQYVVLGTGFVISRRKYNVVKNSLFNKCGIILDISDTGQKK